MNGWERREDDAWYWVGKHPPAYEPSPLQRLVVRWIAISTILVIPIGSVFLVNRHQTNARVSDARAAIRREADLRREAIAREKQLRQVTSAANRALTIRFNRVQSWASFDNCVSNEKQDAVIVSILRSVPVERRSQAVRDAIEALEPTKGDTICIPPPGARPTEAR